MGIEYKVTFAVPNGYDPSNLLQSLPSPIAKTKMQEIYNYAIEQDGFYFIDHLVDKETASLALRLFIDAALKVSNVVQITEA